MTVNVNNASFAGAESLFASYITAAGIMNGFANLQAGDTSAGSGMRRVRGVQTMPLALPNPNHKVIKGDDAKIRTFTFPGDQLVQGNIEVAETDLTFEAAAQGSLVWSLGNWNMGIRGISMPTLSNLMILAHQLAASEDSGSAGDNGYINNLYPNCKLVPLGDQQAAFQAEGKVRYDTIFDPFQSFPLGMALDSSNFGSSDGTSVTWWSKYRTLFYGKIGDGTWTSAVLDFTPVNAASTKAYVTHAGVTTAATISSVTPSTKTVVLSVAPALNDYVVIMYEAQRLS